jgi:hypothetical protein
MKKKVLTCLWLPDRITGMKNGGDDHENDEEKSHYVMLSVVFDRPCSQAEADAAVRDNIHGVFYPTSLKATDPERFHVRGVSRQRASA